jgi:hypothetical protein
MSEITNPSRMKRIKTETARDYDDFLECEKGSNPKNLKRNPTS